MAKKIELLHTTYDESGNIESQEVVHPLTSPDCIIMENGKTLDEVMGDGIATPTLTHEGTSFKVGVGDSNIEVVDGDVAGMTLKGQSYQNILPKPTTLIMETDEQEFKINDKIDSNIIIDDNIAEIATVKGKTIVNAVQEESGIEYTVLDEDLSGQSVVTTNKPEGNIKGVTLQGQTLVNTIQEPCEDDYVVLGADDGIEISAETGGHGTIENTVQGGLNGAVLEGQTLVNIANKRLQNKENTATNGGTSTNYGLLLDGIGYEIAYPLIANKEYLIIEEWNIKSSNDIFHTAQPKIIYEDDTVSYLSSGGNLTTLGVHKLARKFIPEKNVKNFYFGLTNKAGNTVSLALNYAMIVEYQEGMENWDIPYFEGMKSVQMPVVKTTGKNLFDGILKQGYIGDTSGEANTSKVGVHSPNYMKVKPNTTYIRTVFGSYPSDATGRVYFYDMNKTYLGVYEEGTTFTTPENAQYMRFRYYVASGEITPNDFSESNIQIEEGSTATSYEPYQSSTVTTPKIQLTEAMFEQGSVDEGRAVGTLYADMKNTSESTDYYKTRIRTAGTYKVKPNTDYQLKLNSNYRSFIACFNDGKYMSYITWNTQGTRIFTVPSNCNEIALVFCLVNGASISVSNFLDMEVELAGTPTLRKIGDVKDELDLQTGKLTQRIGEVVLDGSDDENWVKRNNGDGTNTITFQIPFDANKYNEIILDKFALSQSSSDGIEGLGYASDVKMLFIEIKRDRLNNVNVDEFKQWLSQNPITVQYRLTTESVKTVDLTVTDQDGNIIPHIQTQPTVTHITASSDYLIPTVTIDNNLAYDTIIKPSTLYTVRFKHDAVNADNPLTVDLGGTTQTVTSTEFTITTPSTLTHNQLVFSGKNNVVSEVQVIEGDMTNIEYPFFEGMSDVKFSDSQFIARGKNLLHVGKGYSATDINGLKVVRNEVEQTITINGTCTLNNTSCTLAPFYREFKKGETYAFSCKLISGTADKIIFRVNDEQWKGNISCGLKATSSDIYETYIKTFYSDETYNRSSIRVDNGATFNNAVFKVMLEKIPVEGAYTPQYEPYKGVEVQQDVDSIPLTSDMFEQKNINGNDIVKGMSYQQIAKYDDNTRISSKTIIPVKPNTTYSILNNTNIKLWYTNFDKNGGFICNGVDVATQFTTTSDTHYIAAKILYADDSTITPSDLDSMNLILQEVPQEIVLRGIGDVKDELDLTRGEYIQRIYDYTFTGEEAFYCWSNGDFNSDDTYAFFVAAKIIDNNFPLSIMNGCFTKDEDLIISNLLPTNKGVVNKNYSMEGIVCRNADPNYIGIKIKKDKIGDYNGQAMGAWVKSLYNNGNPLKIQFVLATPIIHKVNLTNTKAIPSYVTETHYETITPSDSLIPNITIPSTLNYNVAIKPSTEYTIRANTSDNLTVDLGGATGTLSNGKVTLTTPDTLTHNEVKFSGTGKVKELMVVEGNEIKDNVPFFNGMKDVQMGGIKLVNIARVRSVWNNVTTNTNKTQYTFTTDVNHAVWGEIKFDDTLLKPNTVYTVMCNITNNTITNTSMGNCVKWQFKQSIHSFVTIPEKFVGRFVATLISPSEYDSNFSLYFVNNASQTGTITIENPMVIEGDWTHLDEIPYIESEMIVEQPIIRSQGKNLLDLESKYFNPSNVTYTKSGTTYTVVGNTENYNYGQFAWTTADLWFRKLLGKEVTLSVSSISCTNTNSKACIQVRMECTDGSKVYKTISMNDSIKHVTFTIPSNAIDMALQLMSNNTGSPLDSESTLTVSNIQLELGSTATPYEPYKHQTLYSNRVIGYEENVYYAANGGVKTTQNSINSMLADVEGLSIAYVTGGSSNYTFWDKDNVFISGKKYLDTSLSSYDKNGFIAVPSNAKYMRFAVGGETNAQPLYKVATVTGELPLRSLPNGVCDTLNLVTGEYVQRVGEIVLDGSQQLSQYGSEGGYHYVFNAPTKTYAKGGRAISDRLLTGEDGLWGRRYRVNPANEIPMLCFSLDGYMSDEQASAYLSQNPITVQYELETPIVRKLGFTTKGNYRETKLNGSENWNSGNADANNTICTRYYLPNGTSVNSVAPNMIANSPTFSDYIKSRKYLSDSHGQYEYVSVINEGFYLQIYKNKLLQDSVHGFKQWLSQHPMKVGYLTNQPNTTYSNILKPIFFNNVKVEFMNNNIDIQPELILQARTRNSYVMDMMKANTKYSIKLLGTSGNMLIDGTSYTLTNNRTFISPSTLTNKKLIISGQWYELMIIEGDVTGKNLPYFKGILSSYHDVDEIELYSVNKNLFDMSKVEPYNGASVRSWNTIIKENEVVSVRSGNIEAGQFGAYIKLNVRPNSTYTLYIEMEKDGEPFNGQIYGYENDDLWGNVTFVGVANTTHHLKTSQNAKYITIGFNYGKFPTGTTIVSKNIRLYLGEESINYIPHAHNTTLIEMPTRLETVKVVRPVMESGSLNQTTGANYDDGDALVKNVRTKDYLPVQPGEIIKFYNNGQGRAVNIHYYDINKQFVKYEFYDGISTRPTVPKDCYFVRMYCGKSACSDITLIRQAYKPIQLNSLPNGVRDEIIIKPNTNKAQLIQRVGKIVLDGGASYFSHDINSNAYCQWYTDLPNAFVAYVFSDTLPTFTERKNMLKRGITGTGGNGSFVWFNIESVIATTESVLKAYLQQNPITVYYELATPIIHEIQLKGYPTVYENGTVTLNTDVPHQTLVSYNVNQEQLINTQNETIIRHDQQIDDLYYYIEMYLEEIYQTELFRMKLELSL